MANHRSARRHFRERFWRFPHRVVARSIAARFGRFVHDDRANFASKFRLFALKFNASLCAGGLEARIRS